MAETTASFTGGQIQGKRDGQEDSFGIIGNASLDASEKLLMLLADGMGGHAGGSMASKIAIETFAQAYLEQEGEIADKLATALEQVTEAIAVEVAQKPQLKKMGTTLVGAVVNAAGVQWLSVGDSPLWIYRDGGLIRLNEDHSMAGALAELVDIGRMTEEEALNAPNRNALRSVVNFEESTLVDVSLRPVPLLEGDLLVVASDGVETLSENELCSLLQQGLHQPLEELLEALLAAVEGCRKPEQDNTTILLYRH